jgi:hypothetical protein
MRRSLQSFAAGLLIAILALPLHAQPKPAERPKLGAIERIYPADGTGNIAEYQHFAIKFSKPLRTASLRNNLYCEASSIGEKVGAALLGAVDRAAILKAAGVSDTPEWLTVRCLQRFPFKSHITVSFSADVEYTSGGKLGQQSQATYTVWGDTGFRVDCARENARSDCIPFRPITVRFDAEIDAKAREKIVLKGEGGKTYRPFKSRSPADPFQHNPETDVIFYERLPESARLELVFPDSLKDRYGRPVGIKEGSVRERFYVRTGEYPPLVKFSGRFGIIERNAEPVLPVTVRNLEPAPEKPAPEVAGNAPPKTGARMRTLAVTGEEEIVLLNQKLEAFFGGEGDYDADEGAQEEEVVTPSDEKTRIDRRARSFLRGEKRATLSYLPKPLGAKEFEVVGIPLAKPAYYVVEVESRKLGASLIKDRRTMFVQASALTTNLAVHLKRGQDNTLVWVTTLDKAEPVPGAAISIRDCKGMPLAAARTNSDGVALIDKVLGGRNWNCPYYVFARSGDDLSYVKSNWQQGIETWRFNFPETEGVRANIIHTVFDRMLLRPGETVSMKHVARRDTPQGLTFPQATALAKTVELVHVGSGERTRIDLKWDGKGVAESSWRIPAAVKQGVYEAMIGGVLTGSFRVGEFRVPLMKGEISLARFTSVQPTSIPVDLALSYLAGGVAKDAKVKLRARMLPKALVLPGFEAWSFGDTANVFDAGGGIAVTDGIDDGTWAGGWRSQRYYTNDREQINIEDQDLTLSAMGTARAELKGWGKLKAPKSVVAEMEFADPNGEIQTVTARGTVWNAGLILGLKTDGWVARAGDPMKFQVLALDTRGKPAANVAVAVDTKLKVTTSHRARSVGGTYTYSNRDEIRPLKSVCAGKTDANGILGCTVTPDVSGNILLAARTKDAQGNAVAASQDIWAVGQDEWWFAQEDHDRMDVLPERRQVDPGQVARLQVRMPFREARALVTVERSGILDYQVVSLSGKEPMVDLPVKPAYAPNIYASVLAVRGRAGAPKPTALVDLAKPALKLGIAALDVSTRAAMLKVQVTTDKAVYQTREKVRVKVRVTQADGRPAPEGSEVALAAVDEGLLELLPNTSWDMLSGMYRRRGYGVETASAQMHVVGKRHFGKKALPPGGGGGKSPTREFFDTLLKWQARLALDRNGEAGTEVALNDSLTRFRIAAVATGGESLFGDGSAAITATKDLQVLSGLPAVVREGDAFTVRLALRNTAAQAMTARVEMEGKPVGKGDLALIKQPGKTITLKAGEAQDVLWSASVPADAQSIVWQFTAQAVNGKASDSLRITQRVAPAVPLRTLSQELVEIREPGKPLTRSVALPRTALPGRGQIRVRVTPTLLADTEGIRRYMQSYPFWCLEQRTSKAVALKDPGLWQVIADALPTYLDEDGLAGYFPSSTPFARDGWPSLTAYVLSAATEAGFEVPALSRHRMERGLAAFVEGRLKRDRRYIQDDQYVTLQKLAALEALSRSQKVTQAHLDTLKLDLAKLSLGGLLDWTAVLQRSPKLMNRDALLADALRALRDRVQITGQSNLFKPDPADANRWWTMAGQDAYAVKLLLLATDLPDWKADLPLLAKSALARQVNGRYWQTTANVWAVLAFEKYAKTVGQGGTTGATAVVLAGRTQLIDWSKQPNGGELTFDWPKEASALAIAHEGEGKPWVSIAQIAADRIEAPSYNGFDLKKSITPVEQKVPGQWSRGDIFKVTLEFAPKESNGWVVIEDPVPPGSTILGSGLGRDSQLASGNTTDDYWLRPLYIERTFEAYRAYYEHLWIGIRKVEYSVRLNNEGSFELPRTHIEAMYQPQRFSDLPNPRLEVK